MWRILRVGVGERVSKTKLKSEITEILGKKMGMKDFGEGTVIEVKYHGLR